MKIDKSTSTQVKLRYQIYGSVSMDAGLTGLRISVDKIYLTRAITNSWIGINPKAPQREGKWYPTIYNLNKILFKSHFKCLIVKFNFLFYRNYHLASMSTNRNRNIILGQIKLTFVHKSWVFHWILFNVIYLVFTNLKINFFFFEKFRFAEFWKFVKNWFWSIFYISFSFCRTIKIGDNYYHHLWVIQLFVCLYECMIAPTKTI